MKWIYNNDSVQHKWGGIYIQPSTYYQVQQGESGRFASDDTLIDDIVADKAIVSKGNTSGDHIVGHSAQIDYLKDIVMRDEDGAPLQRNKITRSGWHVQGHGICIMTSKDTAFGNSDEDGTDLGFCTSQLLKPDGQGGWTATTEANNDAEKTVVSWEPNFDYEILGAHLSQAAPPAADMWFYAKGLPGILSLMFANGGVNLKCMGSGPILNFDGKAPKHLKFTDPIPGTNKFDLIMRHAAGAQHEVQLIFELFKA